MVLTLLYFDGEPDGKLDTIEQEHLVDIVRYFADADSNLEVSAWEDMKKAIDYFCGADARLQTGEANTGNKDEQQMLLETCSAFAGTSDGSGSERKYMNIQERGALMTKISEVATVKVKLTHTGDLPNTRTQVEQSEKAVVTQAKKEPKEEAEVASLELKPETQVLVKGHASMGNFSEEIKKYCCQYTAEQRNEIKEKNKLNDAKKVEITCKTHWNAAEGSKNKCA